METYEVPQTMARPKAGATSVELEFDSNLITKLDQHSLEQIAELKLSRFFNSIGNHYPKNLHKLIMSKAEKPLLKALYERTGYNQVQTAKILGINRNTLRKRLSEYEISKQYKEKGE